ncbi:alkaline-phosphatase-like protein [Stachybotrys elegans]|uniref:Arylsulfatase n=1 Tax=Stachybotrys elegans TaxID=80388 RepID=A0A8K0WLL9_9HYPO|nr:alkaline-phosphatase-like protein [Stachybotrys elegans]
MILNSGRVVFATSGAIISLTCVSGRPNFVFVLTDDQDVHMNSLDYMPEVQEHLIAKGAMFDKHFCTVALCCPSRVNLWTGQLSHNTNVTNVQPPWGGYPKFIQNGYNEKHLALWMQQSGYNTFYGGKLFNGYTIHNYDSPHMSGYTESAFFLEPYTYQYFNLSYTRNGREPINLVGNYSTDVLSQLTQEFLDRAFSEPESPFFITVAPIAPHGWLNQWPRGARSGPPRPAPRHRHLFQDYIIPRRENFNPEQPSSVNWIANLDRLNETVIAYNDEYQRLRLRSLMAVDEMVGEIVRRLEDQGVIDNTYIIFSTDNGFHISQHRLHPGKMCGLETDINVPMVIRGPGIEAGSTRSNPSSHSDLAPTIMQLAGNDISDKAFDGSPMDLGLPDDDNYRAPGRSEHVAVEFWGSAIGESIYAKKFGGNRVYPNNTYKGLRIEADDYAFYYSVWCNNAKELYDMKNDPGQMRNLLSPSRVDSDFTLFGQNLKGVVDRLDSLLMVLKSCKEETCQDPWRALHPDGETRSLRDALSSKFNTFYTDQPKVEFEACAPGHILETEGPTKFNVFGVDEGDGNESDEDGTGVYRLDGILISVAFVTFLVLNHL